MQTASLLFVLALRSTFAQEACENGVPLTELDDGSLSLLTRGWKNSAMSGAEEVASILQTPVLEMLEEQLARVEKLGYSRSQILKKMKEMFSKMSTQELAKARLGMLNDFQNRRKRDNPVCVAVHAAAASYRFGANEAMMSGDLAAEELKKFGWKYERGFDRKATDDLDHLGFWSNKKGQCMFVFQGSDSNEDFINNYHITPTTYKGIEGVHSGIVNEIDPLISQIDWEKVHETCPTNEITVVGHSLGGGLAELFAVLLTHHSDPLGAGVHLKALYTFGAMALGKTNIPCDQTDDGAFPGGLYFTARHNAESGDTEVDIVTSEGCGGLEFESVKSDKRLIFGPKADGSLETDLYPAGKLIPKFGGSGFDLHMIPFYQYNLGCIDQTEFYMAIQKLMKMMPS